MKNLTLNRIAMLCLTLSVALLSCKKDSAVLADLFPTSFDKNDYPGEEGDNVAPDESEMLDAINPFGATASTTSAGTRKNLIFHSNNESATALSPCYNVSFTQWASLQRWSRDYSINRSTNFARFGNYSIRFELRKTDGIIGNSKRSEALRYTKSEPTIACERWYAASTFLPNEYVTDPAAESVMQWHTDAGAPPLSLWTQGGKWKVMLFGGKYAYTLGNYEKNKWNDWVWHVKWSPNSDGLIELWKNGVKVFTKTGANIYANSIGGAYFRVGLYKWPWKTGSTSTTSTRIMYVDESRMGSENATYYDVAPGNY